MWYVVRFAQWRPQRRDQMACADHLSLWPPELRWPHTGPVSYGMPPRCSDPFCGACIVCDDPRRPRAAWLAAIARPRWLWRSSGVSPTHGDPMACGDHMAIGDTMVCNDPVRGGGPIGFDPMASGDPSAVGHRLCCNGPVGFFAGGSQSVCDACVQISGAHACR